MLTKGYIFILVSSSNDLYAMNDKSKTKLMCFFYYLPHNLPSPTACSHSWMLPKLMLDVSANHKIMTYMIFLLKVDLLKYRFFCQNQACEILCKCFRVCFCFSEQSRQTKQRKQNKPNKPVSKEMHCSDFDLIIFLGNLSQHFL